MYFAFLNFFSASTAYHVRCTFSSAVVSYVVSEELHRLHVGLVVPLAEQGALATVEVVVADDVAPGVHAVQFDSGVQAGGIHVAILYTYEEKDREKFILSFNLPFY